ncbi:MAG: M15 family metallopeptidase [Rhizobiaceae bacterium]
MKTPFVIAALILAALSLPASSQTTTGYGAPPPDFGVWLQRLADSYPGAISGFDSTHLILRDGTRLPLSDGRTDKDFETFLNDPDIDDMFAQAYPAQTKPEAPALNMDPGRVRHEGLFDALYGDCKRGEVNGNLRTIAWVPAHGGGTVRITTRNGADKALEKVSRELDRLPAAYSKYLVPTAGTYNCRTIAGTNRKSVHAYGAAIDLNVKHANYWRWSKPDGNGNHVWKNSIPAEIVEVFERNGFIWGGRWYHYDTMHFEYRPELMPGPASSK